MDRLDHVGAREDEIVVATFQRLSAKILGREVVALDVRPHCAVVDQDSATQGLQIRGLDAAFGHIPVAMSDCPRRLMSSSRDN